MKSDLRRIESALSARYEATAGDAARRLADPCGGIHSYHLQQRAGRSNSRCAPSRGKNAGIASLITCARWVEQPTHHLLDK
jgi:hypothetical protein